MQTSNITSVSNESKTNFLLNDKKDLVFWRPLFRKSAKLGMHKGDKKFFMAYRAFDNKELERPLELEIWGSLNKYYIRCGKCKELLAMFYSDKPKFDKSAEGIHLHMKHDAKHWYGTFGANVSPENFEINFECCCGNKEIKHKGTFKEHKRDGITELKNQPRYTSYYVEEYGSGSRRKK